MDMVLQLYEFIETRTEFALVLECCEGGDLQDAVSAVNGVLGEGQIRRIMKQMVKSVAYCHSKHICHRDVKPHNYMLIGRVSSDQVKIKLGDFGIAVRLVPGRLLTEQMGTPAFMAPEMHLLPRSAGYDNKCDAWALGVCMVFLLANEYPFVDDSGQLLRQEIIKGKLPLWDKGFVNLFQQAQQIAGYGKKLPVTNCSEPHTQLVDT